MTGPSTFADGAIKMTTNRNGTAATYAYDNARRMTNITNKLGSTTPTPHADTLDAVGSATGLLGNPFITYGYDRLDRLTSVTDPATGVGGYTYDPVGNRTSRTHDGSTYAYDRADRIASVVGAAIPGSSTRPPSSNDAGWTASANAYTSNDAYATTAPNKNNTGTVNLGSFGFDATIPANATITGVTVTVEWKVSTAASIATLGAQATVSGALAGTELVNAAEPTTDTSQSFAIPGLTRAQLANGAFGVRVRATRGNNNTAFTASLDAVSVKVDYTAASVTSITVNAVGATTSRGADTFTYDQANRMITATVAGVTETYAYDGDGVRFSRQVGTGPVTRYVSDINTSLPVTIDDGSRRYVWGIGLAYAVSGSAIEVYHTDRLGSVRAITDAAGAVTATWRTDEFGVETATTGTSTQPYGFTGEPKDASGLSYLRARYYDPALARFMTRDRWQGTASTPCTLNRYSYVQNNPVTFSDPSGLRLTNAVGAGVKCGYATVMVVGEVGYAAISGNAVGALLAGGAAVPGVNITLAGVAIFSGLLAIINYEHTQQSIQYCFGTGPYPTGVSTTEKVPPVQYPPGGGPAPAPAPPPVRPVP